ncbi:glycosyltransferase [Myroides odoratus]|uniref:glycosyltransferase n=1 Tax=Myroides odoratus TaxID=256 RepID=UPI00333FA834
MKVLQVINSLRIGGAERLILDSSDLYHNRGINIEILLLDDNESAFRKELQEKYPHIRIQGITKKSIYNPLLIFRIIPFLKNIDILHLHLFPTLYWGVFAKIVSLSKIKIVYTEHNTHNRRRNNKILSIVDKIVYKYINHVGCITDSVADELLSYLGKQSHLQVSVIYNGIYLEQFKGIEKNNVLVNCGIEKKENDTIIVQISNFKKQKDQETLIRSISLLPDSFKLLLVGDGENRKVCELLVEQLNLSKQVFFLGQRTDVVEIMSFVDIVVLSSHWEGFGLAIVEGMAAGKPVIVSDVIGLANIVDGYGLVFEKGNHIDLSKKIMFLKNKENYDEFAQKCLLRASEYDITFMVDQYIELYKKVLLD